MDLAPMTPSRYKLPLIIENPQRDRCPNMAMDGLVTPHKAVGQREFL